MDIFNGQDITHDSRWSSCKTTKHYSIKDFFDCIYSEIPISYISQPCVKIFESSILKSEKILFNEDITIHEDMCFVLDYINALENYDIFASNDIMYHYRKNNGNITLSNSFHRDLHVASHEYIMRLRNIVKKYNCSSYTIKLIDRLGVAQFLRCVHEYYRNRNLVSNDEILHLIRDISSDQFIKSVPIKNIKNNEQKIILLLLKLKMIYLVDLIYKKRHKI